jgi:hypothetical protein
VPVAPPLVTTKELDEKEDEDEIVFTDSVWCCIVPNAPDSETTCIVPHAPNYDKALSTWCHVTEEDEVYYENYAWCCIVPNAPNSDTTFTHVTATINDDDKIVHDANILHKDTSSAESASICENNENCDTDHIPKTLSNNGGLWWIVALIMTAGIYLFNGAAFAITGPAVYIGQCTLKEMKHQGEIFWISIEIPLIFVSTVMWDTLSFLTAPWNKEKKQSLAPRRLVRKCNQRIKRIQPNLQSL